MTNYDHGNCVRWSSSVLNTRDHSRGRQEQDHDNEYWDHSPSQFHLRAAVDLRRLAPVVFAFFSKLYCGINQQAEDHNEDSAGNHQREHRYPENRMRRRGDGGKDVSRAHGCNVCLPEKCLPRPRGDYSLLRAQDSDEGGEIRPCSENPELSLAIDLCRQYLREGCDHIRRYHHRIFQWCIAIIGRRIEVEALSFW